MHFMSNGINLPEMLRQANLEELTAIGREEIAKDFMPAAVTGLADGDFVLVHTPYTGRH